MSLTAVVPGSCCPVRPCFRDRPRAVPGCSSRVWSGCPRPVFPGRSLLSLGVLQLLLGASVLSLSAGALSLSGSTAVRSACPLWTGSSVILSGVVGLTTWRRPVLLLVNVFVLLCVVCVLLNLAGFILCCQGAQLVSSLNNCHLSDDGAVCFCCSVSPTSECPEEKLLELQPAHSCNTMRILLKKVLFALCALNALTTAVCLMVAAIRFLNVFTSTNICRDEPGAAAEESDEVTQVPDPDEFVAPPPPPSYFAAFYSYTPRLARRMLRDSMIPLPHIYGARIKGVEVFCPLDPPPPYEAVAGGPAHSDRDAEEDQVLPSELTCTPPSPQASAHVTSPLPGPSSQLDGSPPAPHGPLRPSPRPVCSPAPIPHRTARVHRSTSDPLLKAQTAKVQSCGDIPLTTDSSTQTSQTTLAPPTQAQVTLRQANRDGDPTRRPRPSSMVDYQSYRHTQQLVRRILDQPAASGLTAEVSELVESIRSVLQSDQEHMEEAVRCASYIEQVFTDSQVTPCSSTPSQQKVIGSSGSIPSQQLIGSSQTFPRPPRRPTGVLHLQSCGDLSSFTTLKMAEQQGGQRPGSRGSRAGSQPGHPERPHSLIGVCRETVL